MLHRCAYDYCKYESYPCRFGFPYKLQPSTELELVTDSDGKYHVNILFKRNHPFLVPFNDVMLVSWGCNCDFKLILDDKAVLSYILNYATKGESLEKNTLKSIINSIKVQDTKYASHETSSSLLNAVASPVDRSRIVSTQECIHIILGQSLYWTDLKYK